MEKLSQAQKEAKNYIDHHNLESMLKDMLNALVHAKDPKPELFIIDYFSKRVGQADLKSIGLNFWAGEPEVHQKVEVPAIVEEQPTEAQAVFVESNVATPKQEDEEVKEETVVEADAEVAPVDELNADDRQLEVQEEQIPAQKDEAEIVPENQEEVHEVDVADPVEEIKQEDEAVDS